MTVTAILQARYSSSRLPGKVLLPIVGKAMLEHQIQRIRLAKEIDTLVVATSLESSDDAIEILCQKINVLCYRGSLNDVLDRFYQTAKKFPAEHIVRMTGDCPVIDPLIIDKVIQLHLQSHAEYTTNTLPPTYPDGLDVEVFKFNLLEQAWQHAKLPSEREHVTPYIRKNKKLKIKNCRNSIDLSQMRWTVDEKEDYDLICSIYEALYPCNPHFDYLDILKLFDDSPNLQFSNAHIKRNEGYTISLEKEAK